MATGSRRCPDLTQTPGSARTYVRAIRVACHPPQPATREGTAMKVGVYVFATDLDLDPGPLAVEIEQRGFDSMFFPEHSHIPVTRATDYPDAYGGGVLPDFYKRTYDPFISCA